MKPREILDIPRYRDDPVFFFVEQLVVDTVEGLPIDAQEWIAQIIKTDVSSWRSKIKEIAGLSETFEVAVLDLWYRNSHIASERGDTLTPRDYSILFVDNLYAEDSRVDVWEPGALEDAMERIARAQEAEGKRRQ